MQVKEAKAQDFEAIYQLLKTLDKKPKRSKWLQLFSYKKPTNKTYGFILLNDNEQIVGFVGTIHSQRTLQNQQIKLCNITSWVVQDAYRNQSLRLLYKALADKSCVYSNLSASKTVQLILEQLKFKLIEQYGIIFVPIFSFWTFKTSLKLKTDLNIIKDFIDTQELQILEDHQDHHLLGFHIANAQDQCLILAKKVKKKSLPFIHIYYISKLDFFGKYFSHKANRILWQHKAIAFLVDERILQGQTISNTITKKVKLPATRLMKSPKDLQNLQLNDNLYSELTLLGL